MTGMGGLWDFIRAQDKAATAPVLLSCCRICPQPYPLMADKGYDRDKIRTRPREQGIAPCIPSRRHGNTRVPYSKRRYKMGHGVENLLAKVKDWRRIGTGYDRCASMFRSAVLLGSTVISWL